jgi:hypothetical protein
MKKKIVIIAILGSILSIIIYFYTRKEEINIVSLGDGVSIGMTPYNIEGYSYNDYLKKDYENIHKLDKYYEFGSFGKTARELIYEIKENKAKSFKDNKIEIQRAINEADILTISIGMDELSEDKITKQQILEYEDDIKELFSMIKMLNNKKVFIIGLYTIKIEELQTIEKLNAMLREEAINNNFTFIDITNIINKKEYYLNNKSYYINYQGHLAIYNEIKKYCKV